MITAILERTTRRKPSDEELKRAFDAFREKYNNNFVLMFTMLHLETMERLEKLEARRK